MTLITKLMVFFNTNVIVNITKMNKRLQKEYHNLTKEPIPDCVVRPGDSILDCYFHFKGAVDTPFEGGAYIGKLRFPPEYPWKAPTIYMITPNGKFRTEKEGPICTSFSHYHPESWNPILTIRTILLGFISMFHDPKIGRTLGGLPLLTDTQFQNIARETHDFHNQNSIYKDLFQEETKPKIVIIKRKKKIVKK